MATNNQNLSVRSYQPQFRELLQAVFASRAVFGTLRRNQLDGVQHNETAFYVKTSDIPVVVGSAYKVKCWFGTGTGKTTALGTGRRSSIPIPRCPIPGNGCSMRVSTGIL